MILSAAACRDVETPSPSKAFTNRIRINEKRGRAMRALRIHASGLRLDEISTPSPREGELLVRVHAAAITRGELDWPTDRLPAIVSYELSGVVVETGEEVFALTPFDRDGVAADYAVVPAGLLAPKPKSLSHVEAAALPMGGLSAWQALFEHGGLKRGERVIVTGARGGVGHLAVQLAIDAGAEVVEESPADLVFDTTGGVLPAASRIVTIAAEAPNAEYFIVEPNRSQLAELGRLADAGVLRPAVDSPYDLDKGSEAFERLAARGKHGKVVLDVAGD
jgi:NADPH:quinone reductase-like Zn-dependent oxidoreductase